MRRNENGRSLEIPDEAMRMADKTMTMKATVKAVAMINGVYATFMPKPIFGINGSGMHTHQSLFLGSKNAFYDASDEYHLSAIGKHYIAGLLKHAREITGICSQWVNSYKRLVPGYEAPVYVGWAQTNRSALIRIPRYTPGRDKAVRAELRCPDPSSNPYLAFTVMLASALDGIDNKLTPPKPLNNVNIYHLTDEERKKMKIASLPGSLAEALGELEKDKVVREALGGTFEAFMAAKRAEWDDFRMHVTDYEVERYLETA